MGVQTTKKNSIRFDHPKGAFQQSSIVFFGSEHTGRSAAGKRWRIQHHQVKTAASFSKTGQPIKYVAINEIGWFWFETVQPIVFLSPFEVVSRKIQVHSLSSSGDCGHAEAAGVSERVKDSLAGTKLA